MTPLANEAMRAPRMLHVGFVGFTADALRRVAAARHEDPKVLADALLRRLLENGMAEELLGEDRAEEIAGGQGRRPMPGGRSLTLLQCAVVYLVGCHGGMTGWCGWSAESLSRLLPGATKGSHVADVLSALRNHGVIERGPKPGGNMPAPHRLTAVGREIFDVLAGER